MGGLVEIGWKEFEKFLTFVGCHFSRQKGDHRIWHRAGLKRPIVFPRINKIPVFVVRNNLRLLGLSPAEYLEITKQL